MKTRIQQGFTLIELLVVITIIAILAGLALPTFSKIQEKGNITKGISNCRQIITTLKIYASDNNGQYPDADASAPTTANDAFRLLFVAGACDSEQIFGCPASLYNGDGNIGNAAGNYTEAVKAKENHWALLKGSSNSSAGSDPLVFENPKAVAIPPTWDATNAGRAVQGRSWTGGKIIIGLNDASCTLETLTANTGTVGLKKTTIFAPGGTALTGPILDIVP